MGKSSINEAAFEHEVMDQLSSLLDFLATRQERAIKPMEARVTKAALAISVIAVADHVLSDMPVEMAFQYRQAAKDFNRRMQEWVESVEGDDGCCDCRKCLAEDVDEA